MNDKRKLVPIAVCLLLSVLVISISQYYGIALKDIIAGLFANALYGLLIAFYMLRFVLVFLGVFAIYRILRGRYNRSIAA